MYWNTKSEFLYVNGESDVQMTGYFIASNFYAQYVTTIKLSFKQPGKYPPLATDSDDMRRWSVVLLYTKTVR